MAVLIDAINLRRKIFFELEGTPFRCLDKEISTPTARGGQTLVRIKMRNMLTGAVLDKTFKAEDKFKEPDLETVPASYLYTDADGSYFLDQGTFETHQLDKEMMGDGLDMLLEGTIVQINKFNGNPIGMDLPQEVELVIRYTEPAVRGDTSSGSVTKAAELETGATVRVPLFVNEGEKIRVKTESREFAGRV
jgi:elongation factor P